MLVEHVLSGLIALVLAAAFTGAAIYVNVAEQPARLALDDRAALTQWRASYTRGFAMQASLALLSALVGLWVYWLSRDWRWFVGAVVIFANWPYTLLVILPVNKRLMTIEPVKGASVVSDLLRTWGRLHAGRSVLGLVATALYVWAMVRAGWPPL